MPLTTRAPFGFYTAARTVESPTGVLVFPEYRELKRLPLFDRTPAQENPFPQIGMTGEFIGVRDYRPGDSRRQVHWRSTARAGRLIVKEFAEETQPGLTIALDLRAASVLGTDPHTSLELAIKIAATLARYADKQRLSVHLAVNSRQWPAPPGPVSWWGLLNYLARVEAAGDESFADCLRASRSTPFLAAVLTAPDPSAIAPLLEARRTGLGVLAIVIDPTPFGGRFGDVPRIEAALLTLGFTGRVNYNINSKIAIFAGYSLLSSESEEDPTTGLEASASVTSFDIDGHYHFSEGSTKPYVLAGISIWRVKAEVLGLSVSASETGINVGGGVLHSLSDKFSLFGEAKYVIIDGGQAVFTVGAHYGF